MSEGRTAAQRSSLAGRCILVIDDSEAVRTALDVLLSLHGARVLTAAGPEQALTRLREEDVDLVVQDMNFHRQTTSGEEGIALFHQIRREIPEVPVILLTAWTHLDTAVDLVKAGAADYLAKPWDDTRLLTSMRTLLELRSAREEAQELRERAAGARTQLAARFDLKGLTYESGAMHTVVCIATQVAHADVPVLITGPSGAGKEILADIVQANSSVRDKPYLKVNLGALPDELMEAELFGTEAGAFTGAKARVGRFEAADGGTLFLDELGNLSASGQAKLLRVLQTGELSRLGSNVTRTVRVRIIAATNASLKEAMRAGAFREDLFYRLNVIELSLPPLAARREDILPLARCFLEGGRTLGEEAQRALLRHTWPGNVRELQNAIRRACLLSPGPAIPAEALGLPAEGQGEAPQPEREQLEAALTRAGGVVAAAARELGLSRQALYRRMEKLGLKV
jgi:DNA-binding NtrC family response regulator